MNDENLQKEYIPPTIDILFIEMEQGVAANSGTITPPNSNDEVKEKWEEGGDLDGGKIVW
ncbi:hypothetical protein [Elizabethkingia anophelis]|uniref:Uncharacterized protein n=1 Tax=Elizabethkingia anophelis TaxID=1117645 RepID=A0AAU8UTP0_9FLAO|nr:hypothetical protein [Elizabethkingia anophelis]AQX01463.1 hypothetical protein BBD32_08310 [Elizabethkingia anophelis]OPB63918.1 hypothetical protein BAY11_16730 [Elizabethkingia anophelis]